MVARAAAAAVAPQRPPGAAVRGAGQVGAQLRSHWHSVQRRLGARVASGMARHDSLATGAQMCVCASRVQDHSVSTLTGA